MPTGTLKLTGRLQEDLVQCPAMPDPKGTVAVPSCRPFSYPMEPYIILYYPLESHAILCNLKASCGMPVVPLMS